MTDNHSYDEPTLGSTSGWGSQLNSNFRDLDTDVEIRDTDANKGNYTPKDGALYRATDTGAIYQGDGTSWVLADMEVNSLNTESLLDSKDGQAWETLRGVGYEKGDFKPELTFNGESRSDSMASSSYSFVGLSSFEPRIQWDILFPSTATTQAVFMGRADPGTDQIDIRIRNATDSETVVEKTGITSTGFVVIGPTEYSPTTTTGKTRYFVEIRNSDNSTSVRIIDWSVIFGVKI